MPMWLGVNEADEEEVPYYENALHYREEENKTFYDTAMKDRRPTEGRHPPIMESGRNERKFKAPPLKS